MHWALQVATGGSVWHWHCVPVHRAVHHARPSVDCSCGIGSKHSRKKSVQVWLRALCVNQRVKINNVIETATQPTTSSWYILYPGSTSVVCDGGRDVVLAPEYTAEAVGSIDRVARGVPVAVGKAWRSQTCVRSAAAPPSFSAHALACTLHSWRHATLTGTTTVDRSRVALPRPRVGVLVGVGMLATIVATANLMGVGHRLACTAASCSCRCGTPGCQCASATSPQAGATSDSGLIIRRVSNGRACCAAERGTSLLVCAS